MAIILVAVGAVFGFASSFALARTQYRQALALKIADEYFAVRRDVVHVVSELTDVALLEEIPQEQLKQYRNSVATLFYRHYDLLPRRVLDAMILLHAALEHPTRGPFKIRNTAVVPMTDDDVIEFVRACSVFANSMIIAPMALKSVNRTVRANQAIKLHARNVLHVLSRFSSVDELAAISRRLRKQH